MSLSKKLRFEVFKRDKFTCQYCGEKAPDVVLHVDHVVPRADGGDDEILNLVTACVDCNLGKGARRLSDRSAVEKQRKQLEELQERQEQIEMMVKWQRSLVDIEEQTTDAVAEFWAELLGDHYSLNERGVQGAQKLVKRFGLELVLEAARTAVSTYIEYDDSDTPTKESVEHAWSKVGGICHNRKKWEDNPDQEVSDRSFFAFERRYREVCSHHPPRWQLKQWWEQEVFQNLAGFELDEANILAVQLADLCRKHYKTTDHSGYWSALVDLPGTLYHKAFGDDA